MMRSSRRPADPHMAHRGTRRVPAYSRERGSQVFINANAGGGGATPYAPSFLPAAPRTPQPPLFLPTCPRTPPPEHPPPFGRWGPRSRRGPPIEHNLIHCGSASGYRIGLPLERAVGYRGGRPGGTSGSVGRRALSFPIVSDELFSLLAI